MLTSTLRSFRKSFGYSGYAIIPIPEAPCADCQTELVECLFYYLDRGHRVQISELPHKEGECCAQVAWLKQQVNQEIFNQSLKTTAMVKVEIKHTEEGKQIKSTRKTVKVLGIVVYVKTYYYPTLKEYECVTLL